MSGGVLRGQMPTAAKLPLPPADRKRHPGELKARGNLALEGSRRVFHVPSLWIYPADRERMKKFKKTVLIFEAKNRNENSAVFSVGYQCWQLPTVIRR